VQNRLFVSLKAEDGAVATLSAIAIVPIILIAALLMDSGTAWISKSKADFSAEAAAALSAMHRPACTDGAELDAGDAASIFTANLGDAAGMSVTCEAGGVKVGARFEQPTSFFQIFGEDEVTIATAADATTSRDGVNPASGWR
jgi:hypothetical protein